MNNPSPFATLEPRIGVCYHCLTLIWDGTKALWQAPTLCPVCHQHLILAFVLAVQQAQA